MVLMSSDWWGRFFLWVLMVKWLLVLWGFSGFSGFLMVLMVWNVIPVRQSISGLRQWSPTKLHYCWRAREMQRETEIERQWKYSKCVCVRKCFVGVMTVMDSMLSKLLMRVVTQPLQAIIEIPNPISSFFGLHFLHPPTALISTLI